jgi:hypothetical protein
MSERRDDSKRGVRAPGLCIVHHSRRAYGTTNASLACNEGIAACRKPILSEPAIWMIRIEIVQVLLGSCGMRRRRSGLVGVARGEYRQSQRPHAFQSGTSDPREACRPRGAGHPFHNAENGFCVLRAKARGTHNGAVALVFGSRDIRIEFG